MIMSTQKEIEELRSGLKNIPKVVHSYHIYQCIGALHGPLVYGLDHVLCSPYNWSVF